MKQNDITKDPEWTISKAIIKLKVHDAYKMSALTELSREVEE